MIGDRKIVALCTARIHDSLNYEFLTTLSKQLVGIDTSIFVYNISTDNYWSDKLESAETAIYNLIDYDIVDAVIIMDEQIKSHQITEKLIKNSKDHNKPVITVNGIYEDIPSVCFDFKYGFEMITRHVIEHHKVKDVMFMGGIPGNTFSDARERIFKKVLKDNGIPFKKEMVTYGYFWAGATQDAVQKIILSGHIPEAIICANDVMAINTELILQKFDTELASRVIVTGFDGLDEIYFSSPQITSVRCNHANMAMSVSEILKKILDGKHVPKKNLVKPDLILAGSCGCMRKNISPPDYFTKLSNRFFNFPEETKAVFRIIEKMQIADDLQDAANSLNRDAIYALSVVINKSYINKPKISQKTDNLDDIMDDPFDKKMILFYDSDSPKPFLPRDFSKSDITPNLSMLLKNGYPLIFNELDYSGTTIGYVCFHFGNHNILNYARIPILVTALRTSLGGFASMQYQRKLTEQLDETYKLDSLTGLYNRLGFSHKYKAVQTRLKINKGKLTVLLSDLDKLKIINDVYGHSAGDNAIQQVANSLIHSCPPSALCVRFGGDEMLAVIEGDQDTDEIKQKIEDYLADYNSKSNLPYKIRSSVGVFKTDGSRDIDFETLVKEADKSLYKEKKKHHEEET